MVNKQLHILHERFNFLIDHVVVLGLAKIGLKECCTLYSLLKFELVDVDVKRIQEL